MKKKGWIASVLRAFRENGVDLTEADVRVVVDATIRASQAREATFRLGAALAFYGEFQDQCFDVPAPGYEL